MSLTFTMVFDRIGRPTTGRGCVEGPCRHVIATGRYEYGMRAFYALLDMYADEITRARLEVTDQFGPVTEINVEA